MEPMQLNQVGDLRERLGGAYGTTGSGKTYAMQADESMTLGFRFSKCL
jgi:hypothetical protein